MSSDYETVAAAIRYLEANFRRQPSLDDLAAHLNLSPFHLQRLFKRWAGISPKRFVQYLTVDYARRLLAEEQSVLAATYEAGLSSPSRLHDLFTSVDAVTPGEFKQKGAGLEIGYGFHETPFGECLLATTNRGICDLAFLGEGGREAALETLRRRWSGATLLEQPEATRALAAAIFSSEPDAEPGRIPLVLEGTNFQVKVWEALLAIPAGHAASYEDVAASMGRPTAVRAVASAVAANHIAYLIPCHRVVRQNGDTGEYRWSATRKKALLGWEAAHRYGESDLLPAAPTEGWAPRLASA